MRSYLTFTLGFLLLTSGSAQDQPIRPSHDWLTWGGDPQRTGWAKSENILSKDNVSKLEIKWKAQLDTIPKFEVLSTLTAPLVVEGVITAQGQKSRFLAHDTLIVADQPKKKFQTKLPSPPPSPKPKTPHLISSGTFI